jgi:hypothetical protein
MIKLGCFDSNVGDAACQAYLTHVEQVTRLPFAQVIGGLDKITLQKYSPDAQSVMSVIGVQQGLKSIGFFPIGQIDGICGYRTQSGIRLFQEYVRTVEKADDNLVPDGQAGPKTQAHLKRWMDGGLKSKWTETIESFKAGTLGQTEYNDWLALLEKVKQQYLASPSQTLQKVNAFTANSSTRKVAQWDFSSSANVHLIGVRRDGFRGKFEDIFVLLINGLIFKFQGSTDPGAPGTPAGFAFLVQGQHDYHFGWHKATYLALKPQDQVLILRSKVDRLDDAALNSPLEANATINVHWGGPGMANDVTNWSEGCQVINGTVYLNAAGDLIDCAKFAAVASKQPTANADTTRGAYNVLLDLVTTLSSDESSALKYMLLVEADLELNPALKQGLANTRARLLPALQNN